MSPFPFIGIQVKALQNFMVSRSIIIFPVLMFGFLLPSLKMMGIFIMIMLSGLIILTVRMIQTISIRVSFNYMVQVDLSTSEVHDVLQPFFLLLFLSLSAGTKSIIVLSTASYRSLFRIGPSFMIPKIFFFVKIQSPLILD